MVVMVVFSNQSSTSLIDGTEYVLDFWYNIPCLLYGTEYVLDFWYNIPCLFVGTEYVLDFW